MFELDIPGFGMVKLDYLVTDYTGTLTLDGTLLLGVKEKIEAASKFLEVIILTADALGTAKTQLTNVPCRIQKVSGTNLDQQKEDFVKQLGTTKVVAIGNGVNDAKMLKIARVGIAVAGDEGCSVKALTSADVCVNNILDAFDLLFTPKRLLSTLQF
ncbi:MAG: HAD family hydrolase [Candidatus Bathyarchaeia archaeon]